MTPKVKGPRKPETLLRYLRVALRNAQTLLIDLGKPGEAAVELIRGRVLLRELHRSLKKGRRP